ncbi:MAG: OmpA/MotB domain protein [Friedmanniella sp.]|nr:OmpA/MotB domain protein [Friedmanniella sp.]
MSRRPLALRRLSRTTAVVAVALCLGGLSACSSGSTPGTSESPLAPSKPVTVAGSVVSTAGSASEMDIVVPDPIKASWADLGSKGSGVEWVQVGGDAKATATPVDLASGADVATTALTKAMNEQTASAPDRSALAGLSALKSPAGDPVWVFSPLLDTTGALDFNQLAFDESPTTVVKAAKKAGELPDLKGRAVVFVVTPVAGEQKKLSALQVGYQRAVWEGVARAGGAKKVTFYDGTGTTPRTGTVNAVDVPDPNDAINSQTQGKVSTCTLPAPALFVSDQPTLIDKKATLKALKACVGKLDTTTKITVEGHTAGVAGADNTFAKNLSTQRATEVAALLRELKVPAQNITKVVGYGSSKPIVPPASNPKNRAVVVTFTSQS